MSTYQEQFERALTLMESQDRLSESIELWKRLISDLEVEDEDSVNELGVLHLNLAFCQARLGLASDAIATASELLEEDLIPLGSELGLRLLGIVVEQARELGDLEAAREASEKALAALDQEPGDCSVQTLLETAEARAALAREMSKPDDAEETLATVLELLQASEDDSLDAESRAERLLAQARLLESRAHNRFEGHADEIALLDLEDAVGLLRDALGEDHEETRRVEELSAQVSGNY